MFAKAGDVGQMAGNFSIWMTTRTSQAHELTKNVLAHHQLVPLLALILSSVVIAGIEGMPGAQDYENIRQMKPFKEMNLPPLDLVLKENGVPPWVRKGIVLNATGVDLASRGKWAGWTDMGGITYTMPGKIYDIVAYFMAKMEEFAPTTKPTMIETFKGKTKSTDVTGPTVEQEGKFVRSVPTGVSGFAREKMMTRHMRGDGQTSFLSTHDTAIYQQKGDAEKWLNRFNFKTTRQSENMQDTYNNIYVEQKRVKQTKALQEGITENMVKMVDAYKTKDVESAKRYAGVVRANFQKLEQSSPGASKRLRTSILTKIQKENETAYERQLRELMHTKDAGHIISLLNTLKTTSRNQPSSSSSK
jgi:hypothetical protein